MPNTHDTIDGLLAEFRGYSSGMPASYHVTMSWHDFRRMLDRFDAAHKRERGDCAKLRGALKHIKDRLPYMLQYMRVHWEDASAGGYFDELMLVIDTALSVPPRNCDRPECATTKAAQDVWRREDGGKTAYYEWLLATATEKEGGAK